MLPAHSLVVTHLRQSCGHTVSRAALGGRRVQPSRAIGRRCRPASCRSATLIRSCRRLDVVVVLDRHRGLGHDRAGVDAVVDDEQRAPVTFTPYASASAGAVHARGTTGSSAGWVLTHAAAERGRGTSAPTSFMKPAETTRSGSYAGDGVGQRAVPVLAAW